jgi:hypothetical protein
VSGKRDLNPDGALRITNRVADFHSQLPVLIIYRSAPVHSFLPHSGEVRAGCGQQVGNSSRAPERGFDPRAQTAFPRPSSRGRSS